MNKTSPLLSIIIPTKDRYNYLFEVLITLSDYVWSKNDVEIVIQDNSLDNIEIINFLNKKHKITQIIRYFHSNESLSQAGNSNLATLNARGEYLCFIGDDDCIHKDIIRAVKWMKENKYEILNNTKPEFIWSDLTPTRLGDSFSGMLFSYSYSGSSKIKRSDIQLKKHLKTGGQYIKNLPQFYHGIVKKSLLDKIYEESGTYFPGPSPDMAVATALTKYSDFFVVVDFPLIISGKGARSVGGMGAKGKHIGDIRDISFLPKDTADKWTTDIPFYWSGSTIFAESVIKSLNNTNREALVDNFNFNYLYARCLVFDSKYKKDIITAHKKNKNSSLLLVYFYFVKIWIKRIKIFVINRSILKKLTKLVYHFNVNNIKEAIKILNSETKKIKAPWI
ncbi:glycosyltransferase [Aurantibacter sp.]|uniref:glycosyltransferase n=1 Tax=Aurantibacter sp. TaxID=2807103 RepID=UPI0035C87B86